MPNTYHVVIMDRLEENKRECKYLSYITTQAMGALWKKHCKKFKHLKTFYKKEYDLILRDRLRFCLTN